MKKLFFAAIAAMVMVSVSSVFANSAKSEMGLVMANRLYRERHNCTGRTACTGAYSRTNRLNSQVEPKFRRDCMVDVNRFYTG